MLIIILHKPLQFQDQRWLCRTCQVRILLERIYTKLPLSAVGLTMTICGRVGKTLQDTLTQRISTPLKMPPGRQRLHFRAGRALCTGMELPELSIHIINFMAIGSTCFRKCNNCTLFWCIINASVSHYSNICEQFVFPNVILDVALYISNSAACCIAVHYLYSVSCYYSFMLFIVLNCL